MKKGIKAKQDEIHKFCFRCIGENGSKFVTWDTEPDGFNLKTDLNIKSFKRVGKITTESSNNIGDCTMKAGDRIRLPWIYPNGQRSKDCQDFTVEEFRFCLGIFTSDECRTAGDFTPLCELYEPGAESEEKYIENFGAYNTDMVQSFMNIPKT